jgi:hypothetical protein
MQESEKPLACTRVRQKRNVNCKNGWTEAEDQLLTNLVLKDQTNPNWTEISRHFPGKTIQQISERWNKVVDPSLIKGSWTRKEDEIIINFVSQYGTKKWTKLAAILPGRIGKQCRERWKNHLDPANTKTAWTKEEDMQLVELHKLYGNHWAKIASHMRGRSDNSIKNRWNSTLSRNIQKNGNIFPRLLGKGKAVLNLAAIQNLPKYKQSLPLPIIIPSKPIAPVVDAATVPKGSSSFNWPTTDDFSFSLSGTSSSTASIFGANEGDGAFAMFSPTGHQSLYDQFLGE